LPGILPGIRKDLLKRIGKKISHKAGALDVRLWRKLHGLPRDKVAEEWD
jgi:hypothetical protein